MAIFSLFSGSKPRLIQTGPAGRTRTIILDKPMLTIGRGSDADVVVDDAYLAPSHARIERQKDGAFVVRRMGLNPILLGGQPVLQTATLKPGDVLQFGTAVEFQFVTKGPTPTENAKPGAPGDAGAARGTDPAGEKPAKKPLLKNPAFLGAIGVLYLGMMAGVAMTILGSDDEGGNAPSATMIREQAEGITECLTSARRLRARSEASFRGAVAVGTSATPAASYGKLALTDEPADEAGLAAAVAPIADAYRSAALAGLAAEINGNLLTAGRYYRQAYETVPDINCSAAQFVLERKLSVETALAEAAEE
ncbi:FHA domain-containing protein [Chthonobacter albigriseus]|uniref:FHA domain-containing protein n=1 Tax=Chthonobacter albigriseus TaxID=1683161 RepID=UPI0015EFD1DD